MIEKILYNWLFHYNKYQEKWYAFPREEYPSYFNGESEDHVSAKTHDECLQLAVEREMKIRARRDV